MPPCQDTTPSVLKLLITVDIVFVPERKKPRLQPWFSRPAYYEQGGQSADLFSSGFESCHRFRLVCSGQTPMGRKIYNMKIGRNAETGKFTPVKDAKAQPKTHVVETIKRTPKSPSSKPRGK